MTSWYVNLEMVGKQEVRNLLQYEKLEESPQAICNPHVECYKLSTAREIREIPLVIDKASFLESVWSSNMEIIH